MKLLIFLPHSSFVNNTQCRAYTKQCGMCLRDTNMNYSWLSTLDNMEQLHTTLILLLITTKHGRQNIWKRGKEGRLARELWNSRNNPMVSSLKVFCLFVCLLSLLYIVSLGTRNTNGHRHKIPQEANSF